MEMKVAFRTQNTIQNILRPQPQINNYSRSGIYQLKCLDCPLKYVRQTGRTFKTRYKEHVHDIRSNNSNSGYSSIEHRTHIRHNNRHHGNYNNGEEGKTFEHTGEVSYLQNQQEKSTYE
jgi:transposase-like protein